MSYFTSIASVVALTLATTQLAAAAWLGAEIFPNANITRVRTPSVPYSPLLTSIKFEATLTIPKQNPSWDNANTITINNGMMDRLNQSVLFNSGLYPLLA